VLCGFDRYRGCGYRCDMHERIGLAYAASWEGPYNRMTSAPLCARADDTCDNEDPFL
jgi:hypothetical protein